MAADCCSGSTHCCVRQLRNRQLMAAALASALLLAAALATSLSLMALQSVPGGSHAADSEILDKLPAPEKASAAEESAGGRPPLLVSAPQQLLLDNQMQLSEARFHPSPFLSENAVLNYTVYCDPPADAQLSRFYSEPTWLCKNARVGNRRLPFTDTTTRNQDDLFLLRKLELDLAGPQLPNEMCGRLPERGNNVFLLCELLLASLLNGADSWPIIKSSSVHVPFGNCSLPEHGRAILVGDSEDTAEWHREDRLWPGFIVDIFCSFPLPRS